MTTTNILKYWKNNLADAAMMSLPTKLWEGAIRTLKDDWKHSVLPPSIVEEIEKKYRSLQKLPKEEEVFSIPLLCCLIKCNPVYSHGFKANTGTPRLLCFPAVLKKTKNNPQQNKLSEINEDTWNLYPEEGKNPFIPRPYLSPYEGTTDTIIVGTMKDSDIALGRGKNTWSSWNEYTTFIETFWKEVTKSAISDFSLEEYVTSR